MGTNYYAYVNTCEHCGRSDDKRHIGKSSHGWTFSFRGYRPLAYSEDNTQIESYSEWQAWLRKNNAVIKDECGLVITLGYFLALVEVKKTQPNNYTLYCQEHHKEHAAKDCWLDADGNSFTGNEFC